jgi:uncharacterized protein (TIGR00369 family)
MPTTDPALLAALNEGCNRVPFNAALGLVVEEGGPEGATVLLPYREALIGNSETGVLHGGAVTALLDATCGLAVNLRLDVARRIATLDLRIDYLRPARPGNPVRARAECYRVTRQVAFVRATAYQDDLADAVATASGTFILFEDKRSPIATVLGAQ